MIEIDFKKEFLEYDFDELLGNNVLLYSKEYYLQYKHQYFEKTFRNYELYLELKKNHPQMKNTVVENNRKIYVFKARDIDKDKIIQYKQLIIYQRSLKNNFINHIKTILNKSF